MTTTGNSRQLGEHDIDVEAQEKGILAMVLTRDFKETVQARNLFEIIGYLQESEGVHLEVRAVR